MGLKLKYFIGLFVFYLATLFAGNATAEDSHTRRIKGPFASGPDVTKSCIRCHKWEAKEFIKHKHWTWSTTQNMPDHKKSVEIGKKNGINNFCLAVPSNWPRCTSCHAGYGWKDASFDFGNIANVDCLVCHDTTGTYKKQPNGAGLPAIGVDLVKIAQSVGKTSRQTCGSCHFYGGGGDHIKHGDLDSSLLQATRTYDVHMGIDGANANCEFCHQTTNHEISGQAMSVSTGEGKRVECSGCHSATSHKNPTLKKHTNVVACQTCHIPAIAKDNPTKIWWDWSMAGKDKKSTKDKYGMETYAKTTGEFRWGKNLIPVYAWYNGKSDRYLLGDKIDPQKITYLTKPLGSLTDKNAKIYPFKVMKGKQPYDTENNYLVVPKVFDGYWEHFDWDRAIEDGMASVGIPYSGRYSFIETMMYWKINHLVVPKEQSLQCVDCHSTKGRLDWKALGYKGDPKHAVGR